MGNVRFVGMDVHKESIVIAVAEGDRTAPQVVREIPNDIGRVLKELRRLEKGGALRCCYEAGPTGFTLARRLSEEGIDCIVVAPSLIPRQPGVQIKTDRRDAEKLARFLRSGDLTPVHVPDAATEAMRDLERARQDARNAERVSRHQLSKFLLRHDRHYTGGSWTDAHLRPCRSLPSPFQTRKRTQFHKKQRGELETAHHIRAPVILAPVGFPSFRVSRGVDPPENARSIPRWSALRYRRKP